MNTFLKSSFTSAVQTFCPVTLICCLTAWFRDPRSTVPFPRSRPDSGPAAAENFIPDLPCLFSGRTCPDISGNASVCPAGRLVSVPSGKSDSIYRTLCHSDGSGPCGILSAFQKKCRRNQPSPLIQKGEALLSAEPPLLHYPLSPAIIRLG